MIQSDILHGSILRNTSEGEKRTMMTQISPAILISMKTLD